MRTAKAQLAWRIRATVLPAAILLLVGGMVGPNTVLPTFRLTEQSENAPTKEHCEELTVVGRSDPHRLLRLTPSALATPTVTSTWLPLGHAQHTVLNTPSGHRLPNGLLAPMTC